HSATLTPSQLPLQLDPFLDLSHRGLFAAPWIDRPTPSEVFAVQKMTRTLSHSAVSTDAAGDLTPVLSLLLLIRSNCMLAAMTMDHADARHRYQEALKVCTTTLNLLHHETEGTPVAIAAWVRGVHTLIRAQLAMPDLAEVDGLARTAIIELDGNTDPICRGAEADAHAATMLAQEPAELGRELELLPDRVGDKLAYYRNQIDVQESLLNQRLSGIHATHQESLKLTLQWFALNAALMATLPLNGAWRPDIPWSVPFVIAVPVLWWWTWDKPFRDGMSFFDWMRWSRQGSIALFQAAARDLLHPADQYREAVTDLLRGARERRERIAAFFLFALPGRYDTVDEGVKAAAEGAEILSAGWMAEMSDSIPWLLDDLLPLDPSMLPRATRIYFGR
ncbi:MAG TPA: hypothetical protein VD902_18855, partial [Symbiobacteriaceae bacterium]|nr:hypothetical protein [Symbiobacteriaceae bacterium]